MQKASNRFNTVNIKQLEKMSEIFLWLLRIKGLELRIKGLVGLVQLIISILH